MNPALSALIATAALILAACAKTPAQADIDDARHRAQYARDSMAWQHLKTWAADGNPAAERALADALASLDTSDAWRRARPWYERAAGHGDGVSAFRLARLYAKGSGVAPDRERSRAWLLAAAKLKHPDAACLLGLHAKNPSSGKPDYAGANRWFAQAAEQGSAEAMFQLGISYQEGLGVDRDIARARSWYEKAAGLEMPAALQTLAMAYRTGDLGLPRNDARSDELFAQAAHAVRDFQSALF
ncbi:tetratricopeptide repeat protein [Paludibacterium paludis]|uniref:Sel1 repeat family protein n=1 Tax=Paludibacterium paludis TaxID=1225769 RepID=A0A918UBF2_9NEIS|nr:tetratricopeptide repeat protein [Paludibacterium paludis]GGY23249.1 hypothetical protein GCM10011289_28790 [Paludibacterium paludis]